MIEFNDDQLLIFEKERIECADVLSLLGDLHDDELPEVLKERVEHHIAECEYCRTVRDEYELTISIAHQLQQTEIPLDVHNRLRESLNRRLGLNLK